MIRTFLVDFRTNETAKYFQSVLFRETARIARIEGNTATVMYRTNAELERIGEVARMFNK